MDVKPSGKGSAFWPQPGAPTLLVLMGCQARDQLWVVLHALGFARTRGTLWRGKNKIK